MQDLRGAENGNRNQIHTEPLVAACSRIDATEETMRFLFYFLWSVMR